MLGFVQKWGFLAVCSLLAILLPSCSSSKTPPSSSVVYYGEPVVHVVENQGVEAKRGQTFTIAEVEADRAYKDDDVLDAAREVFEDTGFRWVSNERDADYIVSLKVNSRSDDVHVPEHSVTYKRRVRSPNQNSFGQDPFYYNWPDSVRNPPARHSYGYYVIDTQLVPAHHATMYYPEVELEIKEGKGLDTWRAKAAAETENDDYIQVTKSLVDFLVERFSGVPRQVPKVY